MYSPARSAVSVESEDGWVVWFAAEAPDGRPRRARPPRAPAPPLKVPKPPASDGGMGQTLGELAAALADALGRRKCTIESLGLGGNPLGDDGVIAICDAVVASAATLKVFIVDKCGLTDAAVPALCAALKVIGPTVAMMNLVNDGFTDGGRAQLQAAEPRLGTKNFTLVKEAKGH